ncbi:MAG: peptidase M48, partial [Thiotrichaceae bacterium IS1]
MRYLLLLISYLLTLPCMAIELPDIGNSADAAMSPSEEQKLGEAFFRQIRRQAEVIDDIEVNNYINELGRQLVSYSDNPQQLFQFFVIKEDSINAFAVPGGFIGVHTGLILKTRDESELAS